MRPLGSPKVPLYLVLILPILSSTMTTHSQTPTPQAQPAPSQTPASSPPANPADVTTIESTVAALYDVISGPAGKRNWDRFRSLFIPGARLIANGVRPTGEVVSRVMTVEDYAQRNGPFFEKQGFFEREAARH